MKMSKKTVYIILGIVFMLGFGYIPQNALSQEGMSVLGIFLGLLVLWLNVGIDWPSLLGILALGLLPSIGFNEVFKLSFGNSTFVFLMFTFMCMYAFSKSVYPKKIAYYFISRKWSSQSIWHLQSAFLLSVLLVGLFMSPTVLFFIFLPIMEEILATLNIEKGSKVGSSFIIGLVMVTSLSSAMTPIAHVFSILAMGVYETITQNIITYGDYMMVALPIGTLIFIISLFINKYMVRNENVKITNDVLDNKLQISKQDKLIGLIFAMVILLWLAPTILNPILPNIAKTINSYGTAMPPLLGVIIMAIIKVDGKPLLSVNDAMVNGVSWPSQIMVASTLALGSIMTMENIGLTNFITTNITPLTENLNGFILILLIVIWASIQSNVSSHMVTAQLVTSIAIPVVIAYGLDAKVMAIIVGFMASTGFATPPAMPYVAVSIATKWTDTSSILSYGMMMSIITILLMSTLGYGIGSIIG